MRILVITPIFNENLRNASILKYFKPVKSPKLYPAQTSQLKEFLYSHQYSQRKYPLITIWFHQNIYIFQYFALFSIFNAINLIP